jgi:hypothetical protein
MTIYYFTVRKSMLSYATIPNYINFKLQERISKNIKIFSHEKYAMKKRYRSTRKYGGLPTLQFLTSNLRKFV